MVYQISVTRISQGELKRIQRDTREKIKYRIGELSEDPEKQGKALIGELSGLRSIHAAGRYRVVYRINREKGIVEVLMTGIRKEGDKGDIYALTKKLLRAGLI